MIKGFFGVPGCGKSTLLVQVARAEQKRLVNRYKDIYTINIDIDGCTRISWEDIANYKLENCLILWDEATLNADNRKFKEFTDAHRDFFILHRHVGCDIIWTTQNYDKVDLKIRDLTQELWYMSKSVVPFCRNFTTAKRIYRCININEHTGDLIMGYRFCNFLETLFVSNYKLVYRKPLYKYFDSFDELALADRPLYPVTNSNKFVDSHKFLKKGLLLWNSIKLKIKYLIGQ